MWTVIKYTVYFFLGTFILFILLPILFMLFMSPQYFKDSLIEALQNATGREVNINGILHWTIFPSMGISASNVHINNPSEFAGGNRNGEFLTAQNVTADVALLPLSKGLIQIGTIRIDNAKLNLIKNSLGQINWQLKKSSDTQTAQPSAVSNYFSSKTKGFFKFSSITLAGIYINDSQITYQDQQEKKSYSIDHLNMQSERVALDQPFPIHASFAVSVPQTTQPITVTADANMIINHNLNDIKWNDLKANTNQYRWQGNLEDNLNKKSAAAFSGNLTVFGEHGAFKGIDLYYYSDLADALIHKTTPTKKDTHETPFNQLEAMLEIQDGIVSNRNLKIQADQIEASGHGDINLLTQQIDYQLDIQRFTQGKDIKPRGPAIPLMITGEISSPRIRPDWQVFLVNQLQNQLAEHGAEIGQKIDTAIQKGLQALVNN